MRSAEHLPPLIQGGMGAAVSSWRLARAVSQRGQLGVVSGVALDLILARRLQDGDAGGHCRRALAAFPDPGMARRVLARHLRPGGRAPGAPYAPIGQLTVRPTRRAAELVVLGGFVETWLAKEGHDGLVGINCLEKIQVSTPGTLLGAMLAGVDVVLMGAGVPREIPRTLDLLAAGEPLSFPIDVDGLPGDPVTLDLDPRAVAGATTFPIERPVFLAVVSAHVLAAFLARDDGIRPDGFVVEASPAGGHNAPPRRPVVEDGEVVFGPRDEPDLSRIAALGLPFWVAGAAGTPEALRAAQAEGARGVQVGTVFALSAESGLRADLRAELLDGIRRGSLRVRTDPLASPTGFPFKVADVAGTVADPDVRAERDRLCDLGFLRTPYRRADLSVGYRCAAEPEDAFVRKGGSAESTAGRACVCNGLTAAVGLGQTRADGYVEPPILTLGSDLVGARRLLEIYPSGWSAGDVVDWLVRA